MATTRTAPRSQHTLKAVDLYMSFELGDKRWHISIGDERRSVSRNIVEAGHTEEVADCIAKATARLHTTARARVHSATRPDATAGGCIDGSPSAVWTTSSSTRRASR